jgi:CRISPR/Cas system-associated endonuclease Cas1
MRARGFMHSLQWGTPSLVCDVQELYRHLIDDFVIGYCRDRVATDFILEPDNYSARRRGTRQYLNAAKTKTLVNELNRYLETKVEMPRIRRGKRQELETLINEEALLFAKYLRDERKTWAPRIPAVP